jgi:hypothetical protein
MSGGHQIAAPYDCRPVFGDGEVERGIRQNGRFCVSLDERDLRGMIPGQSTGAGQLSG